MKDEDKRLLRSFQMLWGFAGYTTATRHRDGRAPRAALKRLIALGFIEVRTVTISNWLSDPRIEDHRIGPYVEVRLTHQGYDVRRAQMEETTVA